MMRMVLSPLMRRRLRNFRANRRGWWSLHIFLCVLVLSCFAELIANDKPILLYFDGRIHFPVFESIPETAFGGDFATEADYKDPFVQDLILRDGWMIWPIIPYSYDTLVNDLGAPAPTPPDTRHWLGTDDAARDVAARLIYGFRISVLFGLILAALSSVIGVAAGCIQGYFGGWIDLIGQRFIEVWSSIPVLFLLIIMASLITPGFWTIMGLMLLFSWTTLIGVVRAEVLRTRNMDYVRAAMAMGASAPHVILQHVLPNAMIATLTFMPFIVSGSVTALTALDFIGFGLPPGSPSLGEMLKQGKENLHAPWLGISVFVTIGSLLTCLVFIGEAVRDAFDPRKA
ncbi:MAG: ABC transporter permease [Pseudomonadota bacterium]